MDLDRVDAINESKQRGRAVRLVPPNRCCVPLRRNRLAPFANDATQRRAPRRPPLQPLVHLDAATPNFQKSPFATASRLPNLKRLSPRVAHGASRHTASITEVVIRALVGNGLEWAAPAGSSWGKLVIRVPAGKVGFQATDVPIERRT